MRAAAVLMSALSPDYGGLGAPQSDGSSTEESAPGPLPTITQPKGGGALRGMGEKFSVGSINGTGSLSIPLPVAPGRSNFGPELTLAYDSSSGNGPYGLGWSLSTPMITRKTSTGLPRYWDREESDVFVLSGVEDLVPLLDEHLNRITRVVTIGGESFQVDRYVPRVEGLYARIERWTSCDGDVHWRTISTENVTAIFGAGAASCVSDPLDPSRVRELADQRELRCPRQRGALSLQTRGFERSRQPIRPREQPHAHHALGAAIPQERPLRQSHTARSRRPPRRRERLDVRGSA